MRANARTRAGNDGRLSPQAKPIENFNLLAPVRLSEALFPAMRAKGSGSIINDLSTAGFLVLPPLIAYGCTKAGLTHRTRYLAKECAPEARVTSLCAGTTPKGFAR